MVRKSVILLMVSLILMATFAMPALAVTYSGSLLYTPSYPADSSDGLRVETSSGKWEAYTVSMAWVVTDEDRTNAAYPWKYTYTFTLSGNQAGLSHIVIEGSDNITANDIYGLTGASLASIGNQAVGSGNPGMPESMTGLRFNPLTTSPLTMTWSFYADKMPVWGDFYARSSPSNYAYNQGFTAPDDIDPSEPASNGSLANHILRPDSVVPEPSSLLVLIGGMGALGGFAFKKRK